MVFIHTENKNSAGIETIIKRSGVQNYTLWTTVGSWHGEKESSLIILLVGVPVLVARKIALEIKSVNGQQAVMIQTIPAESTLV